MVLSLVLAITGFAIYFTAQQSVSQAIDNALVQRSQFMGPNFRNFSKNGAFRGGDRHENSPGHDGPNDGNGQNRMPPPEDHKLTAEEARNQGIDPSQIRQIEMMQKVLRPMILDFDGKDVVRPENKAWELTSVKEAAKGQNAFRTIDIDGVKIRVLSAPLRTDGKVTNVLQLAVPMTSEEKQLRDLVWTLVVVLPLAVLLMMVVGVLLTRQALRPVGEIAEAAELIEASNLSERLPVLGKDEFAQLSTTINGMLARLDSSFLQIDQAYSRQKRFTADASHELKTPLTAIKARTGIALMKDLEPEQYKQHLQAISRAADLMAGVVHDLLLLSASDEGELAIRKESCRVGDLISDAIDSVDASNHEIKLSTEEFSVQADPLAITRVLVNVIQNALLYSAEGTTVQVVAKQRDSWCEISVQDEGEGIPEEDVPHIFDRFHRVDKSRARDSGGSGLGLAIAKAIVEAHGGHISLDSVLLQGTKVTIDLPI